jgi:LCP family protein required for cell wall assembly
MKLSTKLILSAVIIIMLTFFGTLSYTFYQFSKIDTVTISKTDECLGIKPKVPLKVNKLSLVDREELVETNELQLESKEIINIAFFGLDRRDKNEPSRSDSIMILSIDEKHNKIKISSIMRDTYVKIKDHGETKINHAYAYGGPQLAIRTLNENFNLDIRNYVAVDFFNCEKLIDAIGGVTIDVKQEEISIMNDYITEVANIYGKAVQGITKVGSQNLNGLQAVAYSRIRYTEGGDFVRTERQRTVLTAMLTKIQSLKVTEVPSAVSNLLPFTETSMKSMDIVKLGINVITAKKMILEQQRFPLDGYCQGKIMAGVWYLFADMEHTAEQLHKFIYEDINYGDTYVASGKSF